MNVYIQTGNITDMRGPCAEGFHVPKWSEFDDIKTMLGVLGLSTGDNARMYLKLPFAGYRISNSGNISSQGTYGYYWCCDNPGDYGDKSNARLGCSLYLSSSSFAKVPSLRAQGTPIRPFKDTPIAPDSNWVVLYQGTGTAGIYHNSTLGLISISSDGTNRVTISDKNLGATTVYNYGDTLSEANCGKYYQWGNNYGFLFTGSITTSSTRVDASTYGPGNYYSSSTFIVYGGDWSSVQNDNLRGGVTGPISMKEVQNIYIGEYEEPVNLTFEYTGSDQNYTIPHDGNYKITAKGAGSRTAAGGLGEGVFSLTGGTVLSIMVGANGGNGNGVKYGFGGSANGGSNAAGGGLSGVFTGGGAITASDSARALVIGGGAGGSSAGTGGAGGGETGGTGTGSYGTAGAGGTQTGRGSGGNQGSGQFQGGNGSNTYGYGGGGGWRGGNGSSGDSSGDDDRGGGGGSGYVLSTASSRVLTQGGGSAAGYNGVVTIIEIR